MKKYISFMTVILSLGALFTACSEKENVTEVAGGRAIVFSAGTHAFSVKGDPEPARTVSLFAASPVTANNALLTWEGSSLTPASPIFWGQYQLLDENVSFYACSPYLENASLEAFTFNVPEDQSTAEGYAAADLMLASTVASPMDESVRLNFVHRMARLVISIDQRVEGTIESVSFSGLNLRANVELTRPRVRRIAESEYKTVSAAPVTLEDGTPAWALIFPSQQTSSSSLIIKMTDGKSYTIDAGEYTFNEGYSYSATAVLDKGLQELSFSAGIVDWLSDSITFGQEIDDPGVQEHTWYFYQSGIWTPLELLSDGRYYAFIQNFQSGNGFRIRRDDGLRYGFAISNYSFSFESGESRTFALFPDSWSYVYTSDGEGVELWFDVKEKTLTIHAVPHEWTLMGTGSMVEVVFSNILGLEPQEVAVDFYADPHYENLLLVKDFYKNVQPSADRFAVWGNEDLTLNVKEDNSVWFGWTWTDAGLYFEGYGYYGVTIYCRVPEYGGWDYNGYGYYDREAGTITFENGIAVYYDSPNDGTYDYMLEGTPLTFILPAQTN